MAINFEKEGKKIADIYNHNAIVGEVYVQEDAEDGLDKIRINDDTYFFPAITDYKEDEQVDRIYVTGETGCGKSSFIRSYIHKFIQHYPKVPV